MNKPSPSFIDYARHVLHSVGVSKVESSQCDMSISISARTRFILSINNRMVEALTLRKESNQLITP